MEAFSIYFLKVNLGLMVMAAGYYLLLRKEKYFAWNRAYLLLSVTLPFLLPLLPGIHWVKATPWPPELPPLAAAERGNDALQTLPSVAGKIPGSENGFPVLPVLWSVYGAVSLALLLQYGRNIIQVSRIIFRSQRVVGAGYTLCLHSKKLPAFSFFRWVVICPESYDEVTFKDIIAHERAHVMGRHSLDVLSADILRIVCWINPAVLLLKRQITINLEFLADREALDTGLDKQHYQFSLLNHVLNRNDNPLVNAFHSSKIKRRIYMMNSNRSALHNGYRLLLAAPFLFLNYLVVSAAPAGTNIDYAISVSPVQSGPDGYYQLVQDSSQYIFISQKAGKLVLKQMWDGKEIIFDKKDELNYYNDEYHFPLAFSKNKAGKISEVLAFERDRWVKAAHYQKPAAPKVANLTPEQLQRYAGKYEMEHDGEKYTLQFVAKAPGLEVTEMWRNNTFTILPASEKSFFGKSMKYPVEFTLDATGTPTQALIFGHDVWKKVN